MAVNNFVATSNQWKSLCTARILCFNKSFTRNCAISTGIPNVGVRCKNNSVGLLESESDKKIRLRIFLLIGIRFQLHPKTSDSLRLRHWLHNPACNEHLHKQTQQCWLKTQTLEHCVKQQYSNLHVEILWMCVTRNLLICCISIVVISTDLQLHGDALVKFYL